MGIQGLFTYINRENIQGAIVDHSIDDINKDIRIYKEYYSKAPKILFNLRAINNYYETTISDVIFGCRFNKIKEDFEKLLGSLKAAGAELVFTSKHSNVDNYEDNRWKSLNKDYESGKLFVKDLGTLELTNVIYARYRKWHNYPWQDTTIIVLTQSAMKFGTFCENDCLTLVKSAAFAQKATDEDFYAICGLDTNYLLYPGSWKFFFPSKKCEKSKEMIFKEYNKQVILSHLNFNYDQLQLLSVLSGNFYTKTEYTKVLEAQFHGSQKLKKIIDFVHKLAPAEKIPLQHDTMDEILREIYGDACEKEDLKRDFAASLNYKSRIYHNGHRFDDKEAKLKLQSEPFSFIAECIYNKLPIVILSPFLDVTDTDMKPLKDLTIDWIQRTGGILFKDRELMWSWPIIHRLQSGDLERIEVEAEIPYQILPEWKNLLNGDVSMDDKYKALAFLTNSVISEENLKEIPLDYLAHALITIHLVQNDSMTVTEAIAITKAMKRALQNSTISRFNYPKKVNARLFRVSALYEKIYMILLNCFGSTGLKDFIADLSLDNVLFQSIYNDMVGWSRGNENYTKENALDHIMKIIKENF